MIDSAETIYVQLLDENVEVRKPVKALRIDKDRFEILDQLYDREIEKWAFEPGDVVFCGFINSDEEKILVATMRG